MPTHMPRPLLSALLLFTLACAHAPESAEAGTLALAQGSLVSGGLTRTYSYFLPEQHEGEKLPLVVALHGRGGDGKGQDTLSLITPLAAKERFLVVFPDGYSRSWHDAREQGPAAEANVDDVAFLSSLIDDFVATRGADPARVYVMGMSNGGFMTLTLACRLADKIAAVASVTGAVAENLKDTCTPARPIPVAMFMGDEDPLVPYEGGEVAKNRGRILAAPAGAELFARLNGCAPEAADELLPDADTGDSTRITRRTWSSCREDAEVRLYTVNGGGHTWPGGKQYLSEVFIGATSRDLSATAEAWSFFQRDAR
jgi:polyhydroxybutyrate depolymerase